MPSILSGLFKQAVDPDAAREPLEDFTTEAVAGAIRREPALLLAALAAAGAFNPDSVDGRAVAVITQYPMAPPGDSIRPDLVLSWSAPFPGRELWIEVKVGAPLSGASRPVEPDDPAGLRLPTTSLNQLTRYAMAQGWAKSLDGVPRDLVLLAPADLRADGCLAAELEARSLPMPGFLSWRSLAMHIGQSVDAGVLWQELAAFLKEKHVVDDLAFPITSREAVSLPDAFRLFRKTRQLCELINAEGLRRHPGIPGGWWPRQSLPREVSDSFTKRGRIGISLTGGTRIKFFCGLDSEDDGETKFVVMMRADPKYGALRAGAHKLAQDAGLASAGWVLAYEGRTLLAVRAHPSAFPTAEAAVEWIMGRCDDLERAGLFEFQRRAVAGADDAQARDAVEDED